MANANLCMFVYARTYVLGLNERCVMHTYVAYVGEQNWQRKTDRYIYTHTEREREREKERYANSVHPQTPYGLYFSTITWDHTVPVFFQRGQFGKKQDHSLQRSFWVKTKMVLLDFDIVLKSVVGIQ